MSQGHNLTITLTDESFDFLERASSVYHRPYSDIIERWLSELNDALSGELFNKWIMCSQTWIISDIRIIDNGWNRSPYHDDFWDRLDGIKRARFYESVQKGREKQ